MLVSGWIHSRVWVFLRCCLNLPLTPCPSSVIWAWRAGVHAHPWSTPPLLLSQRPSWPLSRSHAGSRLSSPGAAEGKGGPGPGHLTSEHGRPASGRLRGPGQGELPPPSGYVWAAPHVGGKKPLKPCPGWEYVCVGVCESVCLWGHTGVSLGHPSLGPQGWQLPTAPHLSP